METVDEEVILDEEETVSVSEGFSDSQQHGKWLDRRFFTKDKCQVQRMVSYGSSSDVWARLGLKALA